MWKATLTSLWARRGRMIMSTLAVVIGVAFIAGSSIFSNMLQSSFEGIVKSGISDVDVSPRTDVATDSTDPAAHLVSQAQIDKIAQVDGVQQAVGTVSATDIYVVNTKGKAIAAQGPPSLGFSWYTAPAYGGQAGVVLKEGRAPKADDEVVIDPDTLGKSGHQIGDTIKIMTPKGVVEQKLVGTATWGGGGTAGATYVFLTIKRAQELFLNGVDAYTSAWVVTKPGADRTKVAADVQKVLPSNLKAQSGDAIAKDTEASISQGMGFINTFLLVFAGIALLIAAFLIVNTFTILVAQRAKELALFRSMGASRGQIRATVIVEALIVGLIGSILGLLGGVGIALGIKAVMAATVYDIGEASARLTPRTIIAGLAVGLIVTLIAALMPAHRATRVPPVVAMTGAQTETTKGLGVRGLVGVVLVAIGAAGILFGLLMNVKSRIAWAGPGMVIVMIGVAIASPMMGRPVIWIVGRVQRMLFGEVGRLAERNSMRQPRRTAATASALMVGLTLVSAMAVFGSSMSSSVKGQVEKTVRGDYVIGGTNFREFPHQVAAQAQKVPGVQSVNFASGAPVARVTDPKNLPKSPDMYLGGMPTSSLDKIFTQKIVSGRMFAKAGEVIIDQETATKDKLKVGDTVTFFAPLKQRQVTVTVVGLFSPGDGVPILTYITAPETLQQLGYGDQDLFVTVYTAPGADKAKVKTELENITAAMPVVSVMDVNEYVKTQLAQVTQLLALVYALLVLSVLIAVLGIVNTLGLSIIERTREIGLLRAIALTRGEVRRMITLESVVVALLGAVVGVGLGAVFGIVLQQLMKGQGITSLSVPWIQLILFIVAAGVIGVVAAVFPAMRAARTNILEAIASE